MPALDLCPGGAAMRALLRDRQKKRRKKRRARRTGTTKSLTASCRHHVETLTRSSSTLMVSFTRAAQAGVGARACIGRLML